MQLSKPIIIVGTGRCGSTAFHRALARHPSVMWLSGIALRWPTKPVWNRWAVTATDLPAIGYLVRGRIRPGECYPFWDAYAYGFSEPCRDLVRSDVTARVKEQVRRPLASMVTRKRNRLLIKLTGWPRIGFLNEILPDAKFIHIIRDGRAVANSLLHVNFWRGWYGPQGWRAGLLSPADNAVWERHNRSFVALAGLEWRIQMRAIEAARRDLDPALFLEVKYEEFCDQPLETYRRVLQFAELSPSEEFERRIRAESFRSTSTRWRRDLTAAQQGILNDVLHEDLAHYGYDGAPPSGERLRDGGAMHGVTAS